MYPFQAVYGRKPPTLLSYGEGGTSNSSIDEQLRERDIALAALCEHLLMAQQQMKMYADRKGRHVEFKIGELVLLKIRPYRQFVGDQTGILPTLQYVTEKFEWHSQPEEVREYRLDKSGNWEVLVAWHGLPDYEASWEDYDEMKKLYPNLHLKDKILQEILSQVQLCSKLEELLLKKKLFNDGDSPQLHAEKVEKLRILSESLANSTLKAEKRIVDHSREQKEEALNFRVAKSKEMVQAEKELTDDIGELENQKDRLEAELKKVNTLLSAARMRLHNAREEREHFDEASNQILVHLKTKEDELFKSVASYKVEAGAVNACKNFLEHTWNLQISQRQLKEEHVDGELEKYGDYFVKLVISLLSSYKGKLEPALSCIRKLEENLSSMKESDVSPDIDDRSLNVHKQRRKLEEEYLDMESKFVSTLSTVDTVRMQFYETKGVVRNLDEKVQETFDALEKIKQEFESIKRPKLMIETVRRKPELPINEKPHIENSNPSFTLEQTAKVRKLNFEEIDESLAKQTKNFSMEAEMAKLDSDEGVDTIDSNEEINDWEFDELGRDYETTSNHQKR
ncbi:myosin-11 isoform X3 [Cucumis melo var. makuwa]|uniref:Myosin-11 isoform X3 n=1 Tax=Cucumis melo var. makuwa TaxID=1194695 RepID=A0A5A7U163_CUCMM|nr:myosin-11 isoform X3 [Cucumis melo var. makuwa]